MLPLFMHRWSWARRLNHRLINDHDLVLAIVLLGMFVFLGVTAWLYTIVFG